jgi:sulfur transfer complex TusBCD TusB component (DsrH family)
MLFLIASAPDTKEFKTAYELAKDMGADICLLQNAVYASRLLIDKSIYVLGDEIELRGIDDKEIAGTIIDYHHLIDVMTRAVKVVGIF